MAKTSTERERERKTERERQTDRQTDRERDREREMDTRNFEWRKHRLLRGGGGGGRGETGREGVCACVHCIRKANISGAESHRRQ